MVAVSDLVPYENNPRRNDMAIDKVANSIKSFGFNSPIIVDGNMEIICGHTRLEASKRLGMTEVPVVIADSLTPEQVKAYRLMDNRSGEMADWDEIKLLEELIDLQNIDFDIVQAGFDEVDLERLKQDFGSDLEEVDLSAELDAEPTPKGEKPYVIQYNIIFNNEAEQIAWHRHLVNIKNKYPDLETISERLLRFIEEGTNENE